MNSLNDLGFKTKPSPLSEVFFSSPEEYFRSNKSYWFMLSQSKWKCFTLNDTFQRIKVMVLHFPAIDLSYLADVDAIVDRPSRLEALHHALLQGFW